MPPFFGSCFFDSSIFLMPGSRGYFFLFFIQMNSAWCSSVCLVANCLDDGLPFLAFCLLLDFNLPDARFKRKIVNRNAGLQFAILFCMPCSQYSSSMMQWVTLVVPWTIITSFNYPWIKLQHGNASINCAFISITLLKPMNASTCLEAKKLDPRPFACTTRPFFLFDL